MFTDIVKSTDLLEAIGDEAWDDLLNWHDATLRSLFLENEGEEIKHGGDGFFVAFPNARVALDCAVAIQRHLAEHRRAAGFAPQVRIGVHSGEATHRDGDYFGRGVNQAARIGAMAGPGEILASEAALEGGALAAQTLREVTLKGIAEPVRVAAVEWR